MSDRISFTPFSQMDQDYDAPIGSYRLKAYRYRLATFLLLGVSLVLAFIFLELAETPRENVLAVQVLKTGVSTGTAWLPMGSSTLLKKGEKR